jgi:hypothetical protein
VFGPIDPSLRAHVRSFSIDPGPAAHSPLFFSCRAPLNERVSPIASLRAHVRSFSLDPGPAPFDEAARYLFNGRPLPALYFLRVLSRGGQLVLSRLVPKPHKTQSSCRDALPHSERLVDAAGHYALTQTPPTGGRKRVHQPVRPSSERRGRARGICLGACRWTRPRRRGTRHCVQLAR